MAVIKTVGKSNAGFGELEAWRGGRVSLQGKQGGKGDPYHEDGI